MKELTKRFKGFREEFPALGDVIVMSMAVDSQEYSKDLIQRAFNKLVSKDEYDVSEKREIVECLVNYSKKTLIP